MVSHLSDEALKKLTLGGHDPGKVYAAYKAAVAHKGAPTVILAHTVKGWTLGPGVEARNITHQAKKLNEAELRIFRDRLELPIPDDTLKEAPYYHPGPESEEVRYLTERRRQLGGPLPKRVVRAAALPAPQPAVDAEFSAGSQTPVSTTMVFTRILRNLIRDPELGPRIVPIIPDEARTFGMAGEVVDADGRLLTRGRGRRVRIQVNERGRRVVDVRVPLAFAAAAARMVPGIPESYAALIEQAVDSNTTGTIVEAEDETGDGVVISME